MSAIRDLFEEAWPRTILEGLEGLVFEWNDLWSAEDRPGLELTIHDDWLRSFRLELSEKRILAGRWGEIRDEILRLAAYALEPPPLYVP